MKNDFSYKTETEKNWTKCPRLTESKIAWITKQIQTLKSHWNKWYRQEPEISVYIILGVTNYSRIKTQESRETESLPRGWAYH